MRINGLDIKRLSIPFRERFRHNSAEHACTQSVMVIAKTAEHVGYGEGCPRMYVTGEDIGSAVKLFYENKDLISRIKDLEGLRNFLVNNKLLIDRNPAWWCAVELALLDLIGREDNKTVEDLLGLPQIQGDFTYTAVVGVDNYKATLAQIKRYLDMGFKEFKIKLSGDLDHDKLLFEYLKRTETRELRVRVDANNLWESTQAAISYLFSLNYRLYAVEEPLVACRYDELRKISSELGTKIVLDESFVNEEQFGEIKHDPDIWILNIRISKLGGLLRTLAIAKQARSDGLDIIVGAHAGETSILTRGALTVANAYRDLVVSQEGAFGTYLLVEDICSPSLKFGKCGELDFDQLDCRGRFGFGLNILPGKNVHGNCYINKFMG